MSRTEATGRTIDLGEYTAIQWGRKGAPGAPRPYALVRARAMLAVNPARLCGLVERAVNNKRHRAALQDGGLTITVEVSE